MSTNSYFIRTHHISINNIGFISKCTRAIINRALIFVSEPWNRKDRPTQYGNLHDIRCSFKIHASIERVLSGQSMNSYLRKTKQHFEQQISVALVWMNIQQVLGAASIKVVFCSRLGFELLMSENWRYKLKKVICITTTY